MIYHLTAQMLTIRKLWLRSQKPLQNLFSVYKSLNSRAETKFRNSVRHVLFFLPEGLQQRSVLVISAYDDRVYCHLCWIESTHAVL